MCREGRHEVVKDLVVEDLVAPGVGPQVHGNNPVPGGPFGARGVLYHQQALLGLLSPEKPLARCYVLQTVDYST